jgi:hypothetical protein
MSHEIVIDDRDAAELEKEGLDADADDDGPRPSSLQKMTLLKTLRVATVDNFQVTFSPSSGMLEREAPNSVIGRGGQSCHGVTCAQQSPQHMRIPEDA